jgi:hypothetical protein
MVVAMICSYITLLQWSVLASAADSASANIYHLQYLLTFDCLDGVRLDQTHGTIVLFGHRSNRDHPLHVAYLDYLATALDLKQSPSISLEPTAGYYDAERRTIDTCSRAIEQDVTHLYDKEGRLSEDSAWYFQELGVPITPDVGFREALSRMLRTAGHKDLADLYHLMDATAKSDSDTLPETTELCRILGIAGAWQDISQARSDGTISQAEEQDEKAMIFLRAVATMTVMEPNKYTKLYLDLKRGGLAPSKALEHIEQNEMQEDANNLQAQTLGELLSNTREIPVPPWITDSTLSDDLPCVHPVFENVAVDSWMARTLFEADLTLKSIVSLGLVADSQLKTLVSGYRSEREFMKAKGRVVDVGSLHHQRAEIVPGSFQITESPDHDSMQFASAPMKIEITNLAIDEKGGRSNEEDPLISEYASEISSHYDDLARVFPTLHKVREAAKIVAVARWIQKLGVQLSLPAQGRLSWKMPESIPAVISARFEIGSGRMDTFVNISGGVELTPERNWNISQGTVSQPADDSSSTVPILASTPTQEAESSNQAVTAGDAPQEAGPALSRAVVLLDQGDAHASMVELDKAIPLTPDNPTLLLLSAQAHSTDGDSAGAAQAMRAYLQQDPQNIPAQRMLAGFQQQVANTQTQAAPVQNTTATSGGVIQPFDWNGQISRAVYSMDERAPELTDVDMAPFIGTLPSPPPPPPVPDCIALRPEIIAFKERRDQLVKDYQQAEPNSAPAIMIRIKQVDAAVVKKTFDLSVAFDDEAPSPPPAVYQTINNNGSHFSQTEDSAAIQLRAISRKIHDINVPVPEISYNFELADERSKRILDGTETGLALFKVIEPIAGGAFGAEAAEGLAAGAEATGGLWVIGVLIAGKGVIAYEDAADVYITRENHIYERSLLFLKDPDTRTKFTNLICELRKNAQAIDQKQYPSGMFEAAKAIVDSSRNSTTRVLWLDEYISPEHRPEAFNAFLSSDVRDDLKRTLMSPQVRMAVINKVVKETSKFLIAKGLNGKITHDTESNPLKVVHASLDLKREGEIYNCYNGITIANKVLNDPSAAAEDIALARSIKRDSVKDLVYAGAVNAVVEKVRDKTADKGADALYDSAHKPFENGGKSE